jgi:DNA-binding HxlR family transcriptional regulator
MTEPLSFRSTCPIASALDLVGDRWTLVIARDMVFGAATFGDFAAGAERIPRNILADRLKKMETAGLVRRERYQERPDRFRYVLTDRGARLLPVIQALATWGAAELPHVMQPPEDLLTATPDRLVAAQARPDTPQA